jgi:hypothetical protein
MSKASEIRRRRKLKRSIGKKHLTRKQMLDLIAVRTMRRIAKEIGRDNFKVLQDTAFSLIIETASDKVERILLEEGYLKAADRAFIHRKMRLSDFEGVGGMISLVSNKSAERTRKLQEEIMEIARRPPCWSWPAVTK